MYHRYPTIKQGAYSLTRRITMMYVSPIYLRFFFASYYSFIFTTKSLTCHTETERTKMGVICNNNKYSVKKSLFYLSCHVLWNYYYYYCCHSVIMWVSWPQYLILPASLLFPTFFTFVCLYLSLCLHHRISTTTTLLSSSVSSLNRWLVLLSIILLVDTVVVLQLDEIEDLDSDASTLLNGFRARSQRTVLHQVCHIWFFLMRIWLDILNRRRRQSPSSRHPYENPLSIIILIRLVGGSLFVVTVHTRSSIIVLLYFTSSTVRTQKQSTMWILYCLPTYHLHLCIFLGCAVYYISSINSSSYIRVASYIVVLSALNDFTEYYYYLLGGAGGGLLRGYFSAYFWYTACMHTCIYFVRCLGRMLKTRGP